MIAEEEQIKGIRDYINAFRRRWMQMLIIGGTLFVIVLIIALILPPVYRSSSTILIEEQEIPTDLVRSTITSYATQRIQIISQRVMSRTNLLVIMDKYNLYVSERRRKTTEEIVGKMRSDIALDMINAEVVDPRSGKPTVATVAFSLSYEGEDPGLTQKVANELTSLYLSENIKNRTEKAAETYSFLTTEAKKLSDKIADLEATLAEFKEKHMGSLPELANLNISVMDRTERELLEAERALTTKEERIFLLETQLTELNPYNPMVSDTGEPVLDPSSRLEMLRSQYAGAQVKYASEHPDVIRLEREIEGLEKQLGIKSSPDVLPKELSRVRSELVAARGKYAPDHPDVIRLTKQVEDLEQEASQQESLPEKEPIFSPVGRAENRAYISLKSQLDSVKSEVNALRVKRNGLRNKLNEYEERLRDGPKIEQEYNILRMDYSNATARYRGIKDKQMEAEIAQELERESKGEKFSLIDPPQFPESPVRPNRPAIIFLGFILSFGGTMGFVFVAESLDSSIRGSKAVVSIMGALPLAIIPYKENEEDIAKQLKIRKYIIISVIAIGILAILLVHFLWTPLDVLWFKGLRKVDTVVGS